MNPYQVLSQSPCQRVSDGQRTTVVSDDGSGNRAATQLMVIVAPQLGDFDSLEYAGWIQREAARLRSHPIEVRMVGIGDRAAGQQFCDYTGFAPEQLWVDPTAQLHRELELYGGLHVRIPGLGNAATAWLNLMLMCAGIGSPGTLKEVLRGYWGDKQAPQLIGADETVKAGLLPPLQGSVFNVAGGTGFQRPFELATLRLRNMTEVLSHWSIYVPDPAYLTQRGATFVFDAQGALLYEYRDRGILGFAENMRQPLEFLWSLPASD
ncbi:MAG: peroxiredoxin-like family protein [Cyanobacteria bacterium P01_G01_bin.54]